MSSTIVAASRFVDLDVPGWAWVALLGTIVALLVGDLLIVHRRPHAVTFRAAAIESGVWIGLGLAFAVVLGAVAGSAAAGEYLSGYLIEKSLSIDNVFVWAVIFAYVGVPERFQFRVLFWGIFGALALRAAFIFAGVTLLDRFDWILYVFGAFLLVTAVKIGRHTGAAVDPGRNPVLRIVRRLVPSTDDYDGQKLFTRRTGAWLATPLFVVLVLIETTDVVFAVDSIPAILAVSHEPFIVFAAERVRDPRAACAVFLPRRHGRPVPLPQPWSRRHPRLRRREDAAHRRGAPADGREPRGHHRCARRDDRAQPARRRRGRGGEPTVGSAVARTCVGRPAVGRSVRIRIRIHQEAPSWTDPPLVTLAAGPAPAARSAWR